MTPTIEESQRTYRQAWQQYLLTADDAVRRHLEDVMDAAQPHCVSTGGPGPEWEAFVNTLPGYCAFWEGFAAECAIVADVLEERLR